MKEVVHLKGDSLSEDENPAEINEKSLHTAKSIGIIAGISGISAGLATSLLIILSVALMLIGGIAVFAFEAFKLM